MAETIDSTVRLLRQYQVRTKHGDSLTEAFDNKTVAESDRDARNKRAQELGIAERYVVVENPSYEPAKLKQALAALKSKS